MSFLQRKLNDQQGGTPNEPAPAAPTMPAPAPVAAAAPSSNGGTYSGGRKKVTPSKIAYLRKMLRPKLLKTPDEADQWKRTELDKVALLSDRIRSVVEKAAEE